MCLGFHGFFRRMRVMSVDVSKNAVPRSAMLNLQGPWIVRGLASAGTLLGFIAVWLAWGAFKSHTPTGQSDDVMVYLVQLTEQQIYSSRMIFAGVLLVGGIICWVGACIVAAMQGRG